jgi:hypothetical protein
MVHIVILVDQVSTQPFLLLVKPNKTVWSSSGEKG